MSGYYLLKNGEFAYNKSYSVGYDFGSIKRLERYPMGALSTLYICFSLKKYNSDFMRVYFDSLKWYREIYMIAAEGARNHGLLNVPTEDFFNTRHILPIDTAEQKKIATFLLLLDQRLEKQRQLVESLKSYKRGALKVMFPQNGENVPRVRFKGFTGTWVKRKFESIAVRGSKTTNEHSLPRVEYEDIISNEGRLNKNIFLKESSKTGLAFNSSDVLYGKLRPYLHNWLLPTFSGVAVGDFWVLQPQNADSSFVYRLIQSEQFDIVANLSTGTKMPRADWNLVSQTMFSIPSSIEEQKQIGLFFANLDNLITLWQHKTDEFERLKQILLNKLFI